MQKITFKDQSLHPKFPAKPLSLWNNLCKVNCNESVVLGWGCANFCFHWPCVTAVFSATHGTQRPDPFPCSSVIHQCKTEAVLENGGSDVGAVSIPAHVKQPDTGQSSRLPILSNVMEIASCFGLAQSNQLFSFILFSPSYSHLFYYLFFFLE